MAKAIIAAGVAPKGDTAETVFLKLQAGLEHGFPPTAALKVMCVVNGKLAIEGKGLLAIIRRSKIGRVIPGNDGVGEERFGFVDWERFDTGEKGRVMFSKSDAQKAGLLSKPGDTYKNYLDDMLLWRAVSRCADRHFSDITLGLEARESAETYQPTPYAPVTVLPQEPARGLPAPAGEDPLLAAQPIDTTAGESAVEEPPAEPSAAAETKEPCDHPGLPPGLRDNMPAGEERECTDCGEIIRGPGKNVVAKTEKEKGRQGRLA